MKPDGTDSRPPLEHELAALARAAVVDRGVAPAASLAVAARDRDGFRFATGAAGSRSRKDPTPVDPATPFDLASVTKPFVACAAARLVRAGRIGWQTPLGIVVPELEHTPSGGMPLVHLLSHRAGLDAHQTLCAPLELGRPVDRSAAALAAARARRSDCPGPVPDAGFPPLYSDLGYLLAGIMASRAARIDLGALVDEEVALPTGSDVTSAAGWRSKAQDFASRVAPTEWSALRGGEVSGEVHDENAWALAGRGVAGHAGLFGTALGVARFGARILDALDGNLPDWLTRYEALELVRPRAGGTLRAGFDGKAAEGSSAGSEFGPRSFGHLGFTGTSVWCDPDIGIVAVILTNRVNPTRDNVLIRQARPTLNDALHRLGRALGSG